MDRTQPQHEELHVVRGRRTGVGVAVAVHSTAAGPATGGCRMMTYPSWRDAVDDVLRLSEAMTAKCALAGLPHGGGKAVVMLPVDGAPSDRGELLADLGDVIGSLDGRYVTGPDIGTGPEDMVVLHAITGGHAYCRPEANGGSGDSAAATARGVLAVLRTAVARRFGRAEVAGLRVGVIGHGHVGSLLARTLADDGADVRVHDIDPARQPDVQATGLTWWPQPDLTQPLDVLVPAATGGLLTPATARTCGARVIVGPANNQLTDVEADQILHERAIVWVPDVLASSGGVAYAVARERLGLDAAGSEELVDRIGQTTAELFAVADEEDLSPLQAVGRLVDNRVAAAGGPRVPG